MRSATSVSIILLIMGGCAREISVEAGASSGGGSSEGGHGQGGGSASVGSSSSSGGGASTSCAPGETKPCYEGPASTKDVGACKGGVATCAPDGAGFGPCAGQTLPAKESCGDALDSDCNGNPNNDCACVPGSTQTCYTGPQGTQGVGACKAGLMTCAADGSGYGPCAGEVLPGSEVCGNLADEDCDGLVNEADAGCDPNECAGCVVSAAPACTSSAVVVGHYEGGSKTVCIAAGDGSTFDLALMSYDPTNWTLVGATNRISKLQIYSFDPGTTIQGNGVIPTSLQTGGNVPANPYDYAMSMGDCPAHTGYAGAVFGVAQANVCHMEAGLPNACGYPGYMCLAISP